MPEMILREAIALGLREALREDERVFIIRLRSLMARLTSTKDRR